MNMMRRRMIGTSLRRVRLLQYNTSWSIGRILLLLLRRRNEIILRDGLSQRNVHKRREESSP